MACISKQTYGIVSNVREYKRPAEEGKTEPWQISYVPHGIHSDIFAPIEENHHLIQHFNNFKKHMLGDRKYDFVLYYNNRNIRRKQTSDIILAWNEFCNTLTKEQADKCLLLMHTPIVDPNGTDLGAVKNMLCPKYNVSFSQNHITTQEMSFMYNIADLTINIASNEGFGLSGAESMMCGTPILNNITGGLQDHCGFKFKDRFLTGEDYVKIGSLHDDRIWKDNPDLTWGEWVTPVWPSNRSIQGSPETPYIFDDRARYDDVAKAIGTWYNTSPEDRKRKGLLKSLIDMDLFEIKIAATTWGTCPETELTKNTPINNLLTSMILNTVELKKQPDVYINCSIPSEWNPVGKYNIGITAGIETTICDASWIEGCNRMDLIIVPTYLSNSPLQTNQ